MIYKLLILTLLVAFSVQAEEIRLEGEEPKEFQMKVPITELLKQPTQSVSDLLSSLTFTELVSKFKFEAGAILLVVVYICNYIMGKGKNKQLANTWLKAVGPTLTNNFAMVGFDKRPDNLYMLEESAHEFIFYCSGRDNMDSMEFVLELQNREDFIINYVMSLVTPMKDLITIDIPINSTVPMVLYVLKKRDVKSIRTKSKDMQVTKEFKIAGLPESISILGENVESVDHVIDNYAIKMISQLHGTFNSLHYTDQKVYSQSPGFLRVLLNLSKEGEKNQQAVKLVLYLVDRIATLKLPQGVKAKCQKSREVFDAIRDKVQQEKQKEQIQRQKAEKKKQEELRIKSLPADKQKKELQKQRKREMKDFMKSRTVRM